MRRTEARTADREREHEGRAQGPHAGRDASEAAQEVNLPDQVFLAQRARRNRVGGKGVLARLRFRNRLVDENPTPADRPSAYGT